MKEEIKKMEFLEFIHGRFVTDKRIPSGYTTVASSANFHPSFVAPVRSAVFLGQVDKSVAFDGAFALGELKGANDRWVIFTRFLPNAPHLERGQILYEHHLLLLWEEFQALGGNFRPLVTFFQRKYPNNVIPTFSEFEPLLGQTQVELLPERERLATLWSGLKTVIHPNLVHSLLLALFYDNNVSVSHFPRTKNPRADEELALDVTELITLLLPLPWRSQLTFATQLFEPDRSPVRLRFDIGRDDRIRVNWKNGEVSHVFPKENITKRLRYADEVVSLLEQNLFDELAELIKQIKISPLLRRDGSSEKELYKAWEPLAEKFFLAQRIEQNWVTSSRWLALLRSDGLNPEQKAIGLAKLTHLMLRDQKGKLKKIWRVVPDYISQADLSVYQKRVRPALEQAPHQARVLFQEWLQTASFRAQPGCRELTRDLVSLLAQLRVSDALNFVAQIWATFPNQPPIARAELLAACAHHATTIEEARRLIWQSWLLGPLTRSDLMALCKAPGLNQLPRTYKLFELLAKDSDVKSSQSSLLYHAYHKEWEPELGFLFGVITTALDLQHAKTLTEHVWNKELIRLAKQPEIVQTPTYQKVLIRLLDVVAEQSLTQQMTRHAQRLHNHLACLFGRFHVVIDMLCATISKTGLTKAWLEDLVLLFQEQNDSTWMRAQVSRIIEEPKWNDRSIQVRLDGCLQIIATLEGNEVAHPAFAQAIQLLEEGGTKISLAPPSILRLLDWLQVNDPGNTASRQKLILRACHNGVHGNMAWTEITKRFFTPPTRAARLNWLHDNFQALSDLPLDEQAQSLARLDQATDRRHREINAILNHTINNFHANWFRAHLKQSTGERAWRTPLPPLKTNQSAEAFVQAVRAESLAQATTALKTLLEWDRALHGLNWIVEAKVGLVFLTELIKEANPQEFISNTLALLARLKDPKPKQELLRQCAGKVTKIDDIKNFIFAFVAFPRLTSNDFKALLSLSEPTLPETWWLFRFLAHGKETRGQPSVAASWREMEQQPAYLIQILRHIQALKHDSLLDSEVVLALAQSQDADTETFQRLANSHLESFLRPLATPTHFATLTPEARRIALELAIQHAITLCQPFLVCYLSLGKWEPSLSAVLTTLAESLDSDQIHSLVRQLFQPDTKIKLSLQQEAGYYYTLVFRAGDDLAKLPVYNRYARRYLRYAQDRLGSLMMQEESARKRYPIPVEELLTRQIMNTELWAIALPHQLRQLWNPQNNEPFEALVHQIIQYIDSNRNPTPITSLTKHPYSPEPRLLCALSQACFRFWQEFEKQEEAKIEVQPEPEPVAPSSWADKLLLWGHKSTNSPSIIPKSDNELYVVLRTVWMTSMKQLRIQRKELTAFLGGARQAFEVAYNIFDQASRAYEPVFKDPTDLNESVSLLLELTLLQSPKNDLAEELFRIWRSYNRRIMRRTDKNQSTVKKEFDDLVAGVVLHLLREGSLEAKQITVITNHSNIQPQIAYSITLGIKYWEIEQLINDLEKLVKPLSQIRSLKLDDRQSRRYAIDTISELDPKKLTMTLEAMAKIYDLSWQTIMPLMSEPGIQEIIRSHSASKN